MLYNIQESDESIQDVINFAIYMKRQFKNDKATEDFLNAYDQAANSLGYFPKGYRGISIKYRGYEIRLKPFDTYNIFFVIDEPEQRVVILRVLKDLQNWNAIMRTNMEYHFS